MKRIYFYIITLLLIVAGCSREIEPIMTNDIHEDSEIKTLDDGTQLRFTNLGPQLFDEAISAAAFHEDAQGKKYLYIVVAGQPAHLLGYDLNNNNKLIADIPLLDVTTSNSLVFSSDGTLYITGGGNVFTHTVGSASIQDLGTALDGQTTLYSLNAGEDGAIYGGTYPGGRVFRYHPQEGFSDLAGQLATGKNYVRSMVYHKGARKIYAGMGTGAQLIEYDIATGANRNILPANYGDQEFLYQLTIVEEMEGGDRLFMTLQNANITLIYNIETGKFENETTAIAVRSVIKSPIDNVVYFTKGSSLYAFDKMFENNFEQRRITGVSGGGMVVKNFGNVLYMLGTDATLLKYDVGSGSALAQKIDIPGQPRELVSLNVGPKRTIWTSGFQFGSNASYNISTRQSTILKGLPETESATMYEEGIYFGCYTKARIYKYNSRLPWSVGSNPKLTATVPNQDRPFAALAVPNMGRLFFGTVPNYGKNGGVLVELDVKNNDKLAYHTVVEDQSVISLTELGGKLFGGSSIWGGLGSMPVANEAKLFVWDIASATKVHEVVPVSGAKFISCLIKGYDGYIWGIAQGTLFKMDPEDYSIIFTKKIWSDQRSSHMWRQDRLVFSSRDNMYYGSIGMNLFRMHPETLALEKLNEVVGHLTLGPDNMFYFIRGSDLWKMEIR